jgi:hypothetical protein
VILAQDLVRLHGGRDRRHVSEQRRRRTDSFAARKILDSRVGSAA